MYARVLTSWICTYSCLCLSTLATVESCSFRLVSPLKWPLISPSYLWALNGFTAAHFTAFPPAISLMTLLSNTVTQQSTEPPLFHFVLRRTIRHPRSSQHNSETACHSWVWEPLSWLSNHLIAHISLVCLDRLNVFLDVFTCKTCYNMWQLQNGCLGCLQLSSLFVCKGSQWHTLFLYNKSVYVCTQKPLLTPCQSFIVGKFTLKAWILFFIGKQVNTGFMRCTGSSSHLLAATL